MAFSFNALVDRKTRSAHCAKSRWYSSSPSQSCRSVEIVQSDGQYVGQRPAREIHDRDVGVPRPIELPTPEVRIHSHAARMASVVQGETATVG